VRPEDVYKEGKSKEDENGGADHAYKVSRRRLVATRVWSKLE